MSDTSIKIKDADGVAHEIDTRSIPNGDERQVFVLGDGENAGLIAPATEGTLAAVVTALAAKLEPGEAVALDAATLTALEAITVNNPTDVSGLATAAKQDKLLTAATVVSYGTGTANAIPVAPADGAGRLMGYSIREAASTPAAASVRFRSGTTVSGTPLGAGVSLAPGESVREWFGPAGINVPTAVFLERITGTTEVTVYWSAP